MPAGPGGGQDPGTVRGPAADAATPRSSARPGRNPAACNRRAGRPQPGAWAARPCQRCARQGRRDVAGPGCARRGLRPAGPPEGRPAEEGPPGHPQAVPDPTQQEPLPRHRHRAGRPRGRRVDPRWAAAAPRSPGRHLARHQGRPGPEQSHPHPPATTNIVAVSSTARPAEAWSTPPASARPAGVAVGFAQPNPSVTAPTSEAATARTCERRSRSWCSRRASSSTTTGCRLARTATTLTLPCVEAWA